MSNESGLRRDAIGLPRIIFFVIAAAAPLTGTLGAIPIAIGLGNGAGAPAAFLAVGLLLVLFSFGYTRMATGLPNYGAFYAYIEAGLGAPAGTGAALVAIVSYWALQVGLCGLLGYFCALLLGPLLPVALPWYAYALAALALVHALGRRGVELSGLVLGGLMILESAVVLLLVAAIVIGGGGPGGLTAAPFNPSHLLDPGAGIALVFALACFIGFEATAIYAEEAKDPERTVPRATYCAVLAITAFFALVSWAIVCEYGVDAVKAAAVAEPGAFWFAVSDRHVGGWLTSSMSFLLIGSTFASVLAFHSMISRYLYVLGCNGHLHPVLASTHERHRSPHVAGTVQSCGSALLVVLCAAVGLDPYGTVFGLGGALGTIGIIAIQMILCLAVVVHFRKSGADRLAVWSTLLAPLLSGAGFAAILCLAIVHLDALAGMDAPWIRLLVLADAAAFAAGYFLAAGRARGRGSGVESSVPGVEVAASQIAD